jgi:predicted DsbA family dithiol-disulfide isomerase
VYFGGERSARMSSQMQSVAKSVGLTMRTRDVIINSRRALGAAELARERGLYGPMHHALFKAHWEGTGRLEDVDDLVRIGSDVGLDGADVREAVESGRYEAVIDENRQVATSAGIDAIPAHVFGRRYLVMGAQPYDVFKQVVDRLQRDS